MLLLQEKHLHQVLKIIWLVLERLVKIQLDQTVFAMVHIGHITMVLHMRYGMLFLSMVEVVDHAELMFFMEGITVGDLILFTEQFLQNNLIVG